MTTHNEPRKKRSPVSYLFLMVLLVFAPGCGGCRGTLAGKVTFNGEPVESGSVVLVGPDSRPLTAAIDENGNYRFTDVLVGESKLAVFGAKGRFRFRAALKKALGDGAVLNGGKGGFTIVLGGPGGGFQLAGGGGGHDVPAIYNDHEKSGLRTTIHRGFNSYDVEMKTEPAPEAEPQTEPQAEPDQ
jgi:hypothetical protein